VLGTPIREKERKANSLEVMLWDKKQIKFSFQAVNSCCLVLV